MIVRNVEYGDLEAALAAVNRLFSANVTWKRSRDFLSNSRGGGQSYRMTLTVFDSGGPGGSRSASGRRIAAACWHVYGAFFDNLPSTAVIVANGRKSRPGDEWVDHNKGGAYRPLYVSDACECGCYWRPCDGPVGVDDVGS